MVDSQFTLNQNKPNFFNYNKNFVSQKIELDNSQKDVFSKLKDQVNNTILNESTPELQNFIDDSCLLRYLRANKWKLDDALNGLKSTIAWRQDFRPDLMKPSEFTKEGDTGKIYCTGFDLENRPIIIMAPSKQNTNDSKAHIRFTVFSIETAIKMLPPNVEKVTILIDLRDYSLKHTVSMSESKEVLTILSSHYPERLGRAFIVEAPWVFSSFFKLISPLLDPVTRDKIRFSSAKPNDENHLTNFIPNDTVFEDFGGNSSYQFESKSYFERLNNLFI